MSTKITYDVFNNTSHETILHYAKVTSIFYKGVFCVQNQREISISLALKFQYCILFKLLHY